MTVVPQPIEGSTFSINEYVWDRVWKGPAIVVGSLEEASRLTVAEIVLPARNLGRVAHRLPDEICRYVRLLVPEDEAVLLRSVLIHPKLSSFNERLRESMLARGIQ